MMSWLKRFGRFLADEWDRFSGNRSERQQREFAEQARKFREEMTRKIAELPTTEDEHVENGHAG